MIGQTKLLGKIDTLVSNDNIPKFMIFVGPKGSGKKTLISYIRQHYNLADIFYELPDIKIDTIRNMISDAITTKDKMIIVIPEADTMSLNAKNALLKIVEEPPKNVYICMLLEDINNTLETIKSRAFVFQMDSYSPDELKRFIEDNYEIVADDAKNLMISVCETPGEIRMLSENNVLDFYDFVELVVDNIAEVVPENAFKSSENLLLKNDEASGKWDLKLFWSLFSYVCMRRYEETKDKKFLGGISLTSRYIQKLRKLGVNKQQTYDMWVFDIREAWS